MSGVRQTKGLAGGQTARRAERTRIRQRQGERIHYTIDAGKFIYTASHFHRSRDKALPVTVNDKIRFAIEKDKVFLLDENGDEHKLKFEKKVLKTGGSS